MVNNTYSDEFKLQVVSEYLTGPLGCRLIAKKYNLPSKNYIFNWKEQLIKKGLLTSDIQKISHLGGPKANQNAKKTPYEKQLEKENLELRAKLAFLQELEKLTDNSKKK